MNAGRLLDCRSVKEDLPYGLAVDLEGEVPRPNTIRTGTMLYLAPLCQECANIRLARLR